jgi:hypothetical protein
MKILMLFHDFDAIGLLFHDFDAIGLLFHDFDIIGSVITWNVLLSPTLKNIYIIRGGFRGGRAGRAPP